MTTPVVVDPVNQALSKLLKPGAKTTEFIGLVAMWAGAIATLLGAFNTHNPTINGVLKIAAVVAAAASHIGYSLARGDTKAALGALTSTLVNARWITPISPPTNVNTGSSTVTVSGGTPTPPSNQSGAVDLIGLVAGVLTLAGLIWLVIGFAHHHLDVFGLVLLLVGIGIYLLFGVTWSAGSFRRRP